MWLAHSGCWVRKEPSAQGRLGTPTLGSPSPAHPVKWHYCLGKKCLAHLNMYLLRGMAFPLLGEVNTLYTKVHSSFIPDSPTGNDQNPASKEMDKPTVVCRHRRSAEPPASDRGAHAASSYLL